MDLFSVIIAFVTVLLGLALPFITDINKDDKYSSETILDLFEENIWNKIFHYCLWSSSGLIIIYLVKLRC